MSSSSKYKKPYKKRKGDREMTDTEFYRDMEGGDAHTSDVLKSLRS